MLGFIAGDIIGSPYYKNPVGSAVDIFFPLFESSAKYVKDSSGKMRATLYEPASGRMTRLCLLAEQWLIRTKHTREEWDQLMAAAWEGVEPSVVEMLAVCGPLSRYGNNLEEAEELGRVLFNPDEHTAQSLGTFNTFMRILYAAKDGTIEDIESVLESVSIDTSFSTIESRRFLSGELRIVDGQLVQGDGKSTDSAPVLFAGLFAALRESNSFEEAVRRSVGEAGPTAVLAPITGAVASYLWDVPPVIRKGTYDRLDEALVQLSEDFEQSSEKRVSVEESFIRISVFSQEGCVPVYFVNRSKGWKDAEEALVGFLKSRDMEYVIVDSAKEFNEIVAKRSVPRDAAGKELVDSFIEVERPSVHSVFYQDGTIRSVFSREGDSIASKANRPSEVTRANLRAEWMQLIQYIDSVRTRIDKEVGLTDLEEGKHYKPSVGMYPWHKGMFEAGISDGDTVRLRCGIDDDGRWWVDEHAQGGEHEEGFKGVLKTMDLVPKNASIKQVRDAIDYFVLDVGKTPDLDEREALKEGDYGKVYETVKPIEDKYASNLSLIASTVPMGELPEAALDPDYIRSVFGTEVEKEREGKAKTDAQSESKSVKLEKLYEHEVFTFGLSNHTDLEFISTCRRFGITSVIDVRPETHGAGLALRERFGKMCEEAGLTYNEFPELSEGKGNVSYEDIMKSNAFREAAMDVRNAAKKGRRILIVSNEYKPLESARFCLVSRALENPELLGLKKAEPVHVRHIGYNGISMLSHGDLERQLLASYGLDSEDHLHPSDRHFINVWASTGEHAEFSNFTEKPLTIVVPKDDSLSVAELSCLFGSGSATVKDAAAKLVKAFPDKYDDKKAAKALEKLLEARQFDCPERCFQYFKTFFFTRSYDKGGRISPESKKLQRDARSCRSSILTVASPAKIKQLGDELKGLDIRAWNDAAYGVMKGILLRAYHPVDSAKAWENLDRTGSLEIKHLQAGDRWGHDFPAALMEVRDYYRHLDGGKYAKSWSKSELYKPDETALTEEGRKDLAYMRRESYIKHGKLVKQRRRPVCSRGGWKR